MVISDDAEGGDKRRRKSHHRKPDKDRKSAINLPLSAKSGIFASDIKEKTCR